ncbi:hypothetical protein quinque_015722 [Culex quinquefasciatus]
MGGKRTKNNTKPSSSGRSAEMLGSTVPTLFGLHDAGAAARCRSCRIVLKKMLKKDPTTKTKALQEFTELISKSELDVVKAVLPFWPRLYGNLSTDVEHRVRETAQQAQAAVVAKAGKNIAPYLKQLAPAWISAQYDTYAPAASMASQSFGSAFPPSKLREVSNTPEECENKYQRVLIASLRGYALYLSKVPEEQLHKSVDKNGALLDNGKFWSYHKHKTPAIRSAWFEVVSALLQHAPFLVEKHRAQIVSSAFQFMDETDPTVVTHVWSSIVLVQTQIPDWSGHLNFDKAVFPKLWKVLKSGASGNAACVFPHMLPLVSKFTREVLGERTDKFHTLFFESINEGLKAVHSSRTDISAISQAYYEVFQYVVIQTVKDAQLTPQQINEFCERMLEEHLIKVIQWCITTETSSGRGSAERHDEPDANSHHALRFEDQLHTLVYKICRLYVERITLTRDQAYVLNLENLVRQFQCVELFQFLTGPAQPITTLFDTFAGTWLGDSRLQSEYILANKTVRSWLILRALSHPLCQDANITQFLTLPEVSDNLIECARAVTRGDTKENLILLHKCFLISDSGDVLIDPGTCRRIVETLAAPLGEDGAVELKDTCSSFLAQIMPVICGDGRQRELQRVMFALLFKFSAENGVSEYLSEDTLWEVTTAWQDALSSEDLTLDGGLIEDCTRIVDKELTAFLLATCSTEALKRDEVARCAQIDVVFRALMDVGGLEVAGARSVLEKLAVYIDLMSGAIITKSAEYSTNLSAESFTKNARLAMVRELFCLMVMYKLSCNPKKRPSAREDDDSRMDHDGEDEDDGYGEDDENFLHCWSELMYERVLSVLYTIAIGDTMLYSTNDLDETVETLILALQEKTSSMMKLLPVSILDKIKQRLFRLANDHGLLWAKALTALLQTKQYSDPEAGAVLLYEDASTVILSRKMAPKCLPIRPNLFENYFDILVKLAATRSLIGNHFSSSFNEIGDKKIIGNTLIVLHRASSASRTRAVCCVQLTGRLYLDTELANVLADVMRHFPTELDLAKWDFVRIALSSWTLTVSKNHQNFRANNISIFVASIYRLFSAVTKFFTDEKIKSSTEMLTNVIEEWDNVFAKDVNLVLLKAYINIVKDIDRSQKSDEYFLDAISPHIDSIDMNYVLKVGSKSKSITQNQLKPAPTPQANKVDSKTSLDDLITFALANVNHWNAAVRVSAAVTIHKLSAGLIQRDLEQLLRRHEQAEQQQKSSEELDDTWHLLHRFKAKLDEFQTPFGDFVGDFNYKIADSTADAPDGAERKVLGRDRTLAYLLLWDCILGICAKSPSELRSIYASWITRNHYEQILLPALFKLMPPEILKNPDSGAIYGPTLFASLELSQIKILDNPNKILQ